MNLNIEILGEGKVEKVVENNSATLTASPDEDWTFKHFVVGNETVTDSTYTVEMTGDLKVTAVFYVSIEVYLRGLVGFDVSDSALNSIRIFRNIAKGSNISDLTLREKELLYADLLMWAATSPTSYTGSKDADGGWSHTEASKTISVTDKKRFEQAAKTIYKKYLDRKYSSSIKIKNLW